MNEHRHEWQARSDLGMARYACDCGACGFKKEGVIVETPWPREVTVEFKAQPRHAQQPDNFARTIHTDRYHRPEFTPDSVGQEQNRILNKAYRVPGRVFRSRSITPGLREHAWSEWRVNASYLSTQPDNLEIDSPAWFYLIELGTAIDHGPSLEWICSVLEKMNRSALRQLGREAPKKVTYPLDFVLEPKKRRRPPRIVSEPRAEPTILEIVDRVLGLRKAS